ncbi:MAG: lipoyl(octanoyl) transferase LipB [Actinomycetota bacterium]
MTRPGWLLEPSGVIEYHRANEAMHELADRRLEDDVPDSLVLLEHPPVFTAGRTSKPDHAVWDEDRFRATGAEVRHIDRGGSFTFHGPGQLVGYPIVDLGSRPDAIGYIRNLEEVVIRAAADLGIPLHRSPVQTGVWSGDRKVCAIGVRIKRMRVTLHGFAINCTTDLSWFDAIVPCGLASTGVTSLSALSGRAVTIRELSPLVRARFSEVFAMAFVSAPATETARFVGAVANVS